MRTVILIILLFRITNFSYSQISENKLHISTGIVLNNTVKPPLIENSDKIPYFIKFDYSLKVFKYIEFISGISLWQFSAYNSWSVTNNNSEINYSFNESFYSVNIQSGLKFDFQIAKFGENKKLNIYILPQFLIQPYSYNQLEIESYSTSQSKESTTYMSHNEITSNSWFLISYYGETGICYLINDVGFSFGYFINNIDIYKDLRSKTLNNYSLQNVLPEKNINWGLCLRIFKSI